jgi:hypothetical protein
MIVEHFDKLGQDISVDDFVAFPQGNKLMLGKVIKLSNKMLIISTISKKRVRKWTGEVVTTYRKYPNDTIRVDQSCAGLTMYVIQNQ